jgi:hypothetical protein
LIESFFLNGLKGEKGKKRISWIHSISARSHHSK